MGTITFDIPKGYIQGLERTYPHPKISHLYKGDFKDPGNPMCRRGWNRDEGTGYSIWRGNMGENGICKVCLRRAREGKEGVKPRVARRGLASHGRAGRGLVRPGMALLGKAR